MGLSFNCNNDTMSNIIGNYLLNAGQLSEITNMKSVGEVKVE
jgi:hypothetical protein